MVNRPRQILLLAAGLVGLFAARGLAGPPYLTDDPEPTDYQHWEGYVQASGEHTGGSYLIDAPALALNYGPLPDTQLSITVPLATAGGTGTRAATGLGDIQLSVKYRFLHETNGWPQIAFFPAVNLATGDAARGLGNGRTWVQLPVWLQKSFGAWTADLGGGVGLNSAPGQRDNAYGGGLLQRSFGDHLTLGGEFFAQSRAAAGDGAFLAVNGGGDYRFNEHFHILGSAGHTVAGPAHVFWYFALGWNW